MNIPNILTFFRILLIPVFVLVFFSDSSNSLFLSIYIFLIAGFTDVLDGYIARKYNLVTKWGIVVDPLADKLMLITVLSCMVIKRYVPLWVLIIITAKELFMIGAGTLLYRNNTVIPSNIFGKLSTFLFYISIFSIVFLPNLGDFMLYVAVLSAVIAFINYFFLFTNGKQEVKKG